MPRRRSPAINHCLRRAAEAEQLCALSQDTWTKAQYDQLARAWRRLARKCGVHRQAQCAAKKSGRCRLE